MFTGKPALIWATMANPTPPSAGAGSSSDLPAPRGERHTLPAESELRLEIPHGQSATLRLVTGSAEIFGAELAEGRPYELGFPGGAKVAVFTWHGCSVDVDDHGKSLDISYVSEETNANVAYVNTHAQLEAMRVDALAALTAAAAAISDAAADPADDEAANAEGGDGPRVLIIGPSDTGKSSLARVLTAYAVKVGRSPLLLDLDVSSSALSVPGTISASPITAEAASPEVHAVPDGGAPASSSGTAPLTLWYGSVDPETNPDLYRAQISRLGRDIDLRLSGDIDACASGFVAVSSGWVDGEGYKLLLHAADALRVNVVLVMGHDRLYSMLTTHFRKRAEEEKSAIGEDLPAAVTKKKGQPKVIKLPRSGGVVSRDAAFRRACRSQSIRRYFYGDKIRSTEGNLTDRYTPFLMEVPFSDLRLYRLSSVSLSAALLPVSAKQTTEPVQLTLETNITPTLVHAVWAVCHPSAVSSYESSGSASDLYLSGVAGFVAVEKVDVDREVVSLLSPCAGSLPSSTLLMGDITWME
uniref:Protein CLP1 homolog n=1 Tax=Odontella aurita TaxID=265563 RepID=A0A7S4HRL3_9STRA|mmetsp:Transcript_14134/g.41474  ORF Transcript_14134/g.41474 Transcript_14134/m.41474 type:complete len:527 (+) Transcript_14134:1-1581(+)